MKKLLLCLILLVCFATAGQAQTFSIGEKGQMITFQVTGSNEVKVIPNKDKYAAYTLEIPAAVMYQGMQYNVTVIGERAFMKNKMSSVVIPPTVKKIEPLAFAACGRLTSVKFAEGLEVIGDGAFTSSPIESVIIPNSVKAIGKVAFFTANDNIAGKTKIKTVSIPNTNIEIGDHAFNKFCNMVGKWSTSKSEILSLPDWVTQEKAKLIGLHEDSYKAYKAKQNSGSVAVATVSVAPQATRVVQATPVAQVVSAPAAQPVAMTAQPAVASTAGNTAVSASLTAKAAKEKAPSSDVDTNIPKSSATSDNTFAIIIANEHYQSEVAVQYALNDGKTFKKYCEQTLGIPHENIHYREDATLNNIIAEVDWLKKVAQVFDGEARVIFYYAGHGIPDESSKDAYLLPIDGIGSNPATGYRVSDLYKVLGTMKTQNVAVFMDACFSGAQRADGMLASARGVAIKTKPTVPVGTMVVMSAAQGDETAYPYKEKGHGLFTYFLLKKLQESKGACTMEELGSYVKTQVARRSIIVNGKPQTPAVSASASIGDKWKKLTLK